VRKKSIFSAAVEVEEMGPDGNAKMLLPICVEGSIREMRKRKAGIGMVGLGEPALIREVSLGHGE